MISQVVHSSKPSIVKAIAEYDTTATARRRNVV